MATSSLPGWEFAFSIPHIRNYIIARLSARDRRSCSRVCWEFYHLFTPLVWNSIKIDRWYYFKDFRDRAQLSNGQVLIQNQRWIHSLSSIYGLVWQNFIHTDDNIQDEPVSTINGHVVFGPAPLPQTRYILRASLENLTVLRALSTFKDSFQNRCTLPYIEQILAIVELSPNLQSFELATLPPDFQPEHIWRLSNILRAHRSLKEFVFQYRHILYCKYFQTILWGCWNLERVKITADVYEQYRHTPADDLSQMQAHDFAIWWAEHRSTPNNQNPEDICFAVKELDLTSLYSGHAVKVSLPFLRRCHNLERLRLSRVYMVTILQEIAADMRKYWPALEHIDLRGMLPIRNLSDKTQAELVASCGTRNRYGGLRSLIMFPSLEPCPISVATLLSVHATSLETLDLVGFYMESAELQTLLCSCPGLKHFIALCRREDDLSNIRPLPDGRDLILYAKDLDPRQDWVCQRLETLRLRYANGKVAAESAVPAAIQKQIGKLTRLRDLRLGRVVIYDETEALGSKLEEACKNMDDAIRVFSGLTDLERLELRGMERLIDATVLKAARKNWRKIQWIQF
ncbi:hypothetical protein BGZ81_004776 [Podila clonocystis]|nr:hypothetical protein BGZ81_004776 [Podila clonocystis]